MKSLVDHVHRFQTADSGFDKNYDRKIRLLDTTTEVIIMSIVRTPNNVIK